MRIYENVARTIAYPRALFEHYVTAPPDALPSREHHPRRRHRHTSARPGLDGTALPQSVRLCFSRNLWRRCAGLDPRFIFFFSRDSRRLHNVNKNNRLKRQQCVFAATASLPSEKRTGARVLSSFFPTLDLGRKCRTLLLLYSNGCSATACRCTTVTLRTYTVQNDTVCGRSFCQRPLSRSSEC